MLIDKLRTLWLALGLILVVGGPVQAEPAPVRMIDDFNLGIQNLLGGYRNTFQSSPSSASSLLVSDVFRGHSGQSLRVEVNKQTEGFCGMWIHLFDFREPGHGYFDTRRYEYLSFWVRGEKGGEDFVVQMADQEWIEKEDSVRVGSIRQFLPEGITTDWQEVLIPLASLRNLDRQRIGGLTFNFNTTGQHTVYIDDLSFKTRKDVPTPISKKIDAMPLSHRKYPKAMWVWSAPTVLDDASARQQLFAFCKRHDIDQIWLQLLYTFEPDLDLSQPPPLGQSIPPTRCVIHDPDKLRGFLKQAHEAGLQVHALDGYPEYAQRGYHPAPLAVVDAVIEFNQQSPADQRYDGVHFDNEPYLLVAWKDQARREQILRGFIDLIAECQRRVREHSSMQFGIDIPFWWQYRDGETGKYMGQVTYFGRTTAASFICIDMLDNVGIMNYRDKADGADGMIAHGKDLLHYADKVGGAEIFMGIETFAYEPIVIWFAAGLPRASFSRAIDAEARDFGSLSRINGFRFRTFDDGLNVHVGVEVPANPDAQQREQLRQTMVQIAQRFGVSSKPKLADKAKRIHKDAEFAILADVEWTDFQDQPISGPSQKASYAGFLATSLMLSKTTFADNSYDDIQRQVRSAEEYFKRYSKYRGIAIHYYDTYRKITQAAESTTDDQKPDESDTGTSWNDVNDDP